jgi:hypothetical protein
MFQQWLAPVCCCHHHSCTQERACTHARAHTHTHTHTQSNSVTLSLVTSPPVAVLAIAKAAHLICIVYVVQLISLHISQAKQVHHITVNGSVFSAASLYTRPWKSLNLHVHTLDTTQLSTFILSAIVSAINTNIWCPHSLVTSQPYTLKFTGNRVSSCLLFLAC